MPRTKHPEENAMSTKQLLEAAPKLNTNERFTLVEGLLRSLDEPDQSIDAIWAEEASRRLQAYREGRLEGIPTAEVFKEH